MLESFAFLLTTFFLDEVDDECSCVVVVAFVWIHHVDAVLRVRPERV